MSDLADRISRAAVAALDLAPFDDRFSRLSRQVLAGGASRFGRVVADDQAIHFVIPVGLAGERIEYGALVLQDRQAGVLWRDAAGMDHSSVVHRNGDTHSTFSSLTLGGEQWMRFDVESAGEHLTFLVPPVNSPLLRSTLIDFFRARPGSFSAPTPLPEPDPEPAPIVRFPDPEPEPEPEPVAEAPVEASVEPAAVAEADLDATQVLAATDVPEPALEPGGDPEHTDRTPAEQFAAEPALINEWAPEAAELDDATRVRPVLPPEDDDATRVHEPPFDLYRDAPAVPPATPPSWTQAPTQALPTQQPEPAPRQEWSVQQQDWVQAGQPVQSYAPQQQAYAPAPAGTSQTLVGFLIGLLVTLGVGGAVILFNLLGG